MKKEYSKIWVSIIITFCIFWISWSYVLATIGREEIAESLSIKIVVVLLGTFMTYAVKACVENVTKNKIKNKKEEESENDVG